MKNKVLIMILFLTAFLSGTYGVGAAEAERLDISLTISDGTSSDKLLDANYETAVRLDAGTSVTVTSETDMAGLYIIWDSLVPGWELTVGNESIKCGQNGFLHEYVPLPEGTRTAVINIPDGSAVGTQSGTVRGGMRLSDVYAFSDGDLPSWVQLWQPVAERADILFFSTHGDDEHIFFGGVLEEYGKERGLTVQVAYFTQHWVYDATSKIREHEKLNGLWYAGAVNYPILGSFPDAYSTSLNGALSTIGMDESVQYIVLCIRRCKPQVVLTHDINGEYGHGQHMLVSAATIEALPLAADSTYDEDSAGRYGTWEPLKFYVHLYGENRIHIDYRKPLSSFGGMTALEVAKEAYKYHKSQQWCWFYVSDDYEYSISDWGLYGTTVGPDVNCDDFMENVISYAEQDRIEEERIAAMKAEEERLAAEKEEAERKAEEEQRQKLEAEKKAEEERRAAELAKETERQAAELAKMQQEAERNAIITLGVTVLVCVLAAAAVVFVYLRRRGKQV